MASLVADTASLDATLKQHPAAAAIKSGAPTTKADAAAIEERWDALKHRLAAIEKEIPPSALAPARGPPLSPGTAPSGEPENASAAPGAVAPSVDSGGPTIRIESRSVVGDVTQLKGYFEGAALRSAGIYEGSQNVKPLKVEHVTGRQKVEFQLALRDADIATNLRVIDEAGRDSDRLRFG